LRRLVWRCSLLYPNRCFPYSLLVLVAILVVQLFYFRRFESGFDLAVFLKFQTAGYVS
jgi:hypothetical protein